MIQTKLLVSKVEQFCKLPYCKSRVFSIQVSLFGIKFSICIVTRCILSAVLIFSFGRHYFSIHNYKLTNIHSDDRALTALLNFLLVGHFGTFLYNLHCMYQGNLRKPSFRYM